MAKLPKWGKGRLGHWLVLNVGITVIYAILRLWGFTFRRRTIGYEENFLAHIRKGQRFVISSWHGDNYPLTLEAISYYLPHGGVYVMASQSRDGDLMARFLQLSGTTLVRGSSSQGGARALLRIIRAMGPRDMAGLALDGPRGPCRVAKMGALLMARRTNLLICPVVARAPKKWVLKSWDRMEFPRPFSTVTVVYGKPIDIPADTDDATLETLRVELENRLNEMKGED